MKSLVKIIAGNHAGCVGSLVNDKFGAGEGFATVLLQNNRVAIVTQAQYHPLPDGKSAAVTENIPSLAPTLAPISQL